MLTSLLTLLACSGSDTDTPSKTGGSTSGGSVQSFGGAPFEVDVQHALWATSERNTSEDGEAVLVLGDRTTCADLLQGSIFNDFDSVQLEGSGLLFGLFFNSYRRGDERAGFEGLWMSGYAYGGDVSRQMAMLPYYDGFFYLNYGWYYGVGTSTWLRIDAVGDLVTGSFSSDYWSGSFSAEDCGSWEERRDDWQDSDWDSWY